MRQRGLAWGAGAAVVGSVVVACTRVGALDIENGCSVAIDIYSGLHDPGIGAQPSIRHVEPGATLPTYYRVGDAKAIVYVRPEPAEEWWGPIEIEIPRGSAAVSFRIAGDGCGG